MIRTPISRCLALTVTLLLLLPGLSLATPVGEGIPDDEDRARGGPLPGAGEGAEERTVTPDPMEDRFRALLPWPTNRTIYTVSWRPGGDYALAVGSGGTLLKVTTTSIERIETATLQSIYDVAWKPDGSGALLVGNHSLLMTWESATEDLSAVDVPHDQRFLGATWAPSGDKAIIVGRGGYIARFDGTALTKISTSVIDYIYRIRWRPGGDYAVAVGDHGLLMRINTTHVVNTTRTDTSWGLWRVDWVPDGTYALICGKNYAPATHRALVVRYDANGTFQQLPVPGDPPVGLRAVDFSPTGERAVIAGENSTVLRWAGSALTDLMAPGERTLRACAWRGDANELYVAGNRGHVRRYDGAWHNVSFDPRANHFSIAWRPQGDYGIVAGGRGFVAKVAESGAQELDSGTNATLLDADWASDGSYALLCGGGGEVLRYDHGGTSMTSIKSPLMQGALHGISVKKGSSEALVVGDNGHIWHYSGGVWTDRRAQSEFRNLRDVAWRPDGSFAMIVGVSGLVLNYTGGARAVTFQPQPPSFAPFFSVNWDKDGDRALVVGGLEHNAQNDTIFQYSDGQWDRPESHENVPFYGCAYTADGQVAVAFGVPDVVVKFNPLLPKTVRSSFRSPYTSLRRGTMHPVGRAVCFVGPNGYAFRMDVGEFENNPPIPVIASPKAGGTYHVGEAVELSANGTWDPEGDPITHTWVSNVSGVVSTLPVDHVVFTVAGWHKLTLWTDDGRGNNVSALVHIQLVIPNFAPIPVIISPKEGDEYTNEDVITLDANGSYDPNGDRIMYHWVSNVSGDIGVGEVVQRSLRVGEHRIILWVEDVHGAREKAEVNISVVQANRPPIAYITSPLEAQRFSPDEEVELNASYSFDPDGDALTLTWASDRDGQLGEGAVRTVALSQGAHRISVTVEDGHGHVVTAEVNVTVEEPSNEAPEVSIAFPEANASVSGSVAISGTARDPEGGPVTVRVAISVPSDWAQATLDGVQWSYRWDTTEVTNGQYSVFVEADDGERTTRVWTQYFVDNQEPPNTPPEVELSHPEPGTVGGVVKLEGLASDPDGDPIVEVQVRIGSGPWQTADGSFAWSYRWDTEARDDGPVVVSVKAYDGQDWGQVQPYSFTVDNGGDGPASEDGLSGAMIALVVVLLVVVVLALLYLMRLRGPRR